MVRVKDILAWVDALAPFRFAEAWDACGLQVGDPDAEIERLLVALDPSTETLREAEHARCQCLLTHHPLILHPLSSIRSDQYPSKLVMTAIQKGIHLVAAHTNLDVAHAGTNDQLAALLALESLDALEASPGLVGAERYVGLGRVGWLGEEVLLSDFVGLVRRALKTPFVRVVGNLQSMVRKVALCTGSGGSLVEKVLARDVDVYVTGDVKYHEAQRAVEGGLALVDVGHFASERIIVEPMAALLRSHAKRLGMELTILTAKREKDPFVIL